MASAGQAVLSEILSLQLQHFQLAIIAATKSQRKSQSKNRQAINE